jgi:hypothetical protein
MHARGLRLRGVGRVLAITPPPVWPSALLNDVGTPVAIISQLNTWPACAPVNASMVALRLAMHDSGSGWIATPFLYDSFIHNSTPVYPGALSNLLDRYLQTASTTSSSVSINGKARLVWGRAHQCSCRECLEKTFDRGRFPFGIPGRTLAIPSPSIVDE